MKIYCSCPYCKDKIYLASTSPSREHLANTWGSVFLIKCAKCNSQNQVHVNLVQAEAEHKASHATTGTGGILGFMAGPLGVAIGLVAGRLLSRKVRLNENLLVQRFNNSIFKQTNNFK